MKLGCFKYLQFELGTSSPTLVLKAMVSLAAVVAVYHQDLQLVFFDAMQNEATNQALLVLPNFGFLIYRKMRAREDDAFGTF